MDKNFEYGFRHPVLSKRLEANAPLIAAAPLDFARDNTSFINLMGGIGDPDYMKGQLSIRHIDTRESRPRKRKQEQ